MVKAKKNFSFKRAAFFINKNIADSLNLMAVYQNEAIQRGIANKTDIKKNLKSIKKRLLFLEPVHCLQQTLNQIQA